MFHHPNLGHQIQPGVSGTEWLSFGKDQTIMVCVRNPPLASLQGRSSAALTITCQSEVQRSTGGSTEDRS